MDEGGTCTTVHFVIASCRVLAAKDIPALRTAAKAQMFTRAALGCCDFTGNVAKTRQGCLKPLKDALSKVVLSADSRFPLPQRSERACPEFVVNEPMLLMYTVVIGKTNAFAQLQLCRYVSHKRDMIDGAVQMELKALFHVLQDHFLKKQCVCVRPCA